MSSMLNDFRILLADAGMPDLILSAMAIALFFVVVLSPLCGLITWITASLFFQPRIKSSQAEHDWWDPSPL